MINYSIISAAVLYYTWKGYYRIEAPWLTGLEAVSFNAPPGVRQFETFAGYLPASGEQSFIDMRLQGKLPDGKYCCVTPCFRDEPVLDNLHRQYFLKVELIHILAEDQYLPPVLQEMMVSDVQAFMWDHGVKATVVHFPDGQTDLVCPNGIELGSYGVREYKGIKWLYGTGVAEPRFSTARRLVR